MDRKTTLSITEARRKIFQIANEVQKPDTHYTLTARGKPKAVIMSAEEYESLLEALEIKRQFPNLDKDFEQAERELERGETIPLEQVLKEEGYASVSGNRRHVSRRGVKKGKKRS